MTKSRTCILGAAEEIMGREGGEHIKNRGMRGVEREWQEEVLGEHD